MYQVEPTFALNNDLTLTKLLHVVTKEMPKEYLLQCNAFIFVLLVYQVE